MIDMLADVPPLLAAAWAAWFVIGGALVLWYRRSAELEYAPAAPAPRAVTRSKPASRPPSGVRRAEATSGAAEPAFDDASHLYEPPPALAPREKKPVVIGDPFGDLATLLDQPQQPAPPSYRSPGDSPILSSSGVPIRRDSEPQLG